MGMTLEEFEKRIKEDGKKKNLRNWLDKKIPHGIAGYSAFHALTHPWLIVEDWGHKIKWAWQRVVRGWDDRALWSVDSYLADHIVAIITDFKRKKIGIPVEMFDGLPYSNPSTCDYSSENMLIAETRWNDILDKIVLGFKSYNNLDNFGVLSPEDEEKVKESFKLLEKYWSNIWY